MCRRCPCHDKSNIGMSLVHVRGMWSLRYSVVRSQYLQSPCYETCVSVSMKLACLTAQNAPKWISIEVMADLRPPNDRNGRGSWGHSPSNGSHAAIGSLPRRLSQPLHLREQEADLWASHARCCNNSSATKSDGLMEHDKLRFENARTDRGEWLEAEKVDDLDNVPGQRGLVRVAQCTLPFGCELLWQGTATLPHTGLHVAFFVYWGTAIRPKRRRKLTLTCGESAWHARSAISSHAAPVHLASFDESYSEWSGAAKHGKMGLSKMVRHIIVVNRAIEEARRAARHTLGSEWPDTLIPWYFACDNLSLTSQSINLSLPRMLTKPPAWWDSFVCSWEMSSGWAAISRWSWCRVWWRAVLCSCL